MASATDTVSPAKAQANIVRSSKFADGQTRDWSFYVFFRILTVAEMERTQFLLERTFNAQDQAKREYYLNELRSELARPRRLVRDGVEEFFKECSSSQEKRNKPVSFDPSQNFLSWLGLISSGDTSGFSKAVESSLSNLPIDDISAKRAGQTESEPVAKPYALSDATQETGLDDCEDFNNWLGEFASSALDILSSKSNVAKKAKDMLGLFGDEPAKAGKVALTGGMPVMIMYDVLRQIAIAVDASSGVKNGGSVREEADENARLKQDTAATGFDLSPTNIAFTHSGLEALQLDRDTLRSFPDVFKEGMAARAESLGDVGPSAPENWEGELGQDSIHGYFSTGFQVGGSKVHVNEKHWEAVRRQISAFNSVGGPKSRTLRILINGLFRLMGMEIVHLDLGQDPYELDKKNRVVKKPDRMEHFGFRDGISQPFVDMKLGDPPAGGGTPSNNRSWAPIAPGEIILGMPDEDGEIASQPTHATLRDGGTFLVWRKLEQDVPGFRRFLDKQRPGNRSAQDKLAAEMMGRWRNGASLVVSPDTEPELNAADQGSLNDFLYLADDPDGRKCPLGSHARRTNPRDIGENNDVRRHRILRRGMSYGGPLLPDDCKNDGNKRGMFFIAANSRIDLQFEVIQSNWINKDGFFGQAGLGKCPITGSHGGKIQDHFLEAGAAAPISRLPSFVVTRGGDYFFAPSVTALKAIANGDRFALPPEEFPFDGESMGDAIAPSLFDEAQLKHDGRLMLGKFKKTARYQMRKGPPSLAHEEPGLAQVIHESPDLASPVTFVARHEDVSHAISHQVKGGKVIYSIEPYTKAGKRLLRGGVMMIGTQNDTESAPVRQRLMTILNEAWMMLFKQGDFENRLQEITLRELNAGLRRSASTGKIDLVDDLATRAVYAVLDELFGTPGPKWVTEMAVSLPFARQHVGQIYPDWLSTIDIEQPENPGRLTMQIWSAMLFLDVVGNYPNIRALKLLGIQAASEMLAHFDYLLAKATTHVSTQPRTLLEAFVLASGPMAQKFKYSIEEYFDDVRALLLEIVGSPMTIIPANFGSIMRAAMKMRLNLPDLVPVLDGEPLFSDGRKDETSVPGVTRLVYEMARINPTVRILLRRCKQDADLPGGGKIPAGDWVASIMVAANMDNDAFPKSHELSLGDYGEGPPRHLDRYLLFGVEGGHRECWGREKMAMAMLENCIRAASKLEGLQPLAGPGGEMKELLRVSIGLPARFGRLAGTL